MNKKVISILAVLSMAFSTAASAANKYNEMDFICTSGFNISEIAELGGFESVDAFKKEYWLPEDMPDDTNESAAYNMMTIKGIAKSLEKDEKELLKELSNATGEKVTEDDVFFEVLKKLPTKSYVKLFTDTDYDEFKEIADLDYFADVNENTAYADIMAYVDRVLLEKSGAMPYFDRSAMLVMVKGKYLNLDVKPLIVNDRTLVPFRSIFETLGANVSWDDETKTVFATKDDTVIILQIGQDCMFVNGEKVMLDAPSMISEDRTLVPLRAVANALGNEVGYNEKTKTAIIH